MKIAYCSPFSPIKSGISDFSEELIMELKNYVDIDLFYDANIQNEQVRNSFKYYDISKLCNNSFAAQYDVIVYQMGNNYKAHKCIGEMILQRPGIVELHDISLHHYLAEQYYNYNKIDEYIDIVRYCHGEKGVEIVKKFLSGGAPAPWSSHPLELTVNKHYIDSARGVIVHSDMGKQMVKAIRPEVPVINIPLHVPDLIANTPEAKKKAKKKLGINEKCCVFGSFGFATKTKRIYSALEALSKYKKDFVYVVVGEEREQDVKSEAERLGIGDKVTVTGFVSLEQYKLYMQACDICINLRYPTNGESSGNLQRILGMGIPAIVTDIGTFREYPDSCTVKVSYGENEISDILKAVEKISRSPSDYYRYSRNSVNFIKETACLSNNCKLYKGFFEDIINGSFAEQNMTDRVIDAAMRNGFYDEQYLLELVSKCVSAFR